MDLNKEAMNFTKPLSASTWTSLLVRQIFNYGTDGYANDATNAPRLVPTSIGMVSMVVAEYANIS